MGDFHTSPGEDQVINNPFVLQTTCRLVRKHLSGNISFASFENGVTTFKYPFNSSQFIAV